MNITFIACGTMGFPAGGFKVILEYANKLSDDGHNVNIALGAATISLKTTFAALFRFPFYKLLNKYSPRKWFTLNENINISYNFTLFEHNIPNSDIIIATNVESSYYLNNYKNNVKKFYLIQGFENWSISDKKVLKSYRFDMKKIVISPWLKNLVASQRQDSVYIPNGFDFEYFSKYKDVRDRNKFSILVMNHKMKLKCFSDSISAIEIVKKKYPELKVRIFGRPEKPTDIPFDFEYYQSPEKELHNKLYNEAAIYIAASSIEGWGLTIGEAMICGCAVACTDNDGFKIMAHDNETALLSPVYDYETLAKNIIRLIENDELRFRIANKGNETIKDYTWDFSYQKLKSTLFGD